MISQKEIAQKIALYSDVVFTQPVPDEGITAGQSGAVVELFDNDDRTQSCMVDVHGEELKVVTVPTNAVKPAPWNE